jgi:hypothetical protein
MWTASIPCNVRHAVENDLYSRQPDTLFRNMMVLLNHIIQVFALLKHLHWRSRQRRRSVPSTLSSSTGRRIRSALVHVDYPRLRIGWVEQRFTKESLGCRCIALGREQEIGLPCGIHGSVQISVLPFDPDVGLIDTVAVIGPFQVSAAPLV